MGAGGEGLGDGEARRVVLGADFSFAIVFVF